MRRFFKIAAIVLCLCCSIGVIAVALYQPPKVSDFGIFAELRSFTISQLQRFGAVKRPVSDEFTTFVLTLSFPYTKLFGGKRIGVPLESYESDRIIAATISQFEIPVGSGYYRDFTFNLRPRYPYKAPVFHIDFMKPSPGVPGLCSMDFFNVDPETINLEAFFGDTLPEIRKAMELVASYQRTPQQGRGKITAYLDRWKSPYRMELQEPKTDDEQVRKRYYTAVAQAYNIALSAYLTSLQRLVPDPAFTQRHRDMTRGFVQALYTKDFAVNMGKKIFKDAFDKYWKEGFWALEKDMVY
ncbi:MAG: hypothetical protein N3B18_00580 [Desulfobacterota bacterium]|nr:hypothetical protein [Thermodesulfobacteriota bacterium]